MTISINIWQFCKKTNTKKLNCKQTCQFSIILDQKSQFSLCSIIFDSFRTFSSILNKNYNSFAKIFDFQWKFLTQTLHFLDKKRPVLCIFRFLRKFLTRNHIFCKTDQLFIRNGQFSWPFLNFLLREIQKSPPPFHQLVILQWDFHSLRSLSD